MPVIGYDKSLLKLNFSSSVWQSGSRPKQVESMESRHKPLGDGNVAYRLLTQEHTNSGHCQRSVCLLPLSERTRMSNHLQMSEIKGSTFSSVILRP